MPRSRETGGTSFGVGTALQHASEKVPDSIEVTVAGFKKEGTSVAVVWFADEVPSDALEWKSIDLTIQGVTFQDPVYVEMITGKVYELDQCGWKAEEKTVRLTKLPVWDSPVMIAERSKTNLKP